MRDLYSNLFDSKFPNYSNSNRRDYRDRSDSIPTVRTSLIVMTMLRDTRVQVCYLPKRHRAILQITFTDVDYYGVSKNKLLLIHNRI